MKDHVSYYLVFSCCQYYHANATQGIPFSLLSGRKNRPLRA